MISNKTYNNVINTLKNVGDNHYQIQTTTVGDIWQVDLAKETKFPLMHINPVNVTTGQAQLNYNFQIFVMDLVSEKESWTNNAPVPAINFQSAVRLGNEQEVLSDCLSICVDLIGIFRHSRQQSANAGTNADDINAPIYFTDGEFTLEPFSERFDNEVTGWVFTLTVEVVNTFQTCNIPMDTDGTGE